MGTITGAKVDNQDTYDGSSMKPLALQYSQAESGVAVLLSDLTGNHYDQVAQEPWVR